MTKDQIVQPNWERVSAIFWMLLVLAVAIIVVCCMTGCAPHQCKRSSIVITSHPTRPRPAGRITVGCDDTVVSEILADEVVK